MAGSTIPTNIGLGAVAYLSRLPAASDDIVLVLLKGTLEADDTLRDYDTLSALLGNNSEADFTGYTRQVMSGVTATPDDGNNRVRSAYASTLTYSSPGTGQTIGKAIVCYRPTGSGSADSAIVPLTLQAANIVLDGNSFDISFPAGYFYQAS